MKTLEIEIKGTDSCDVAKKLVMVMELLSKGDKFGKFLCEDETFAKFKLWEDFDSNIIP